MASMRRAERTTSVPNRTSPLLAAMAAAYPCDHLRIGSYVLDIGFWNPSVLARDVATLMRLTDGGLELGPGTGLLKYQFDDAGFEFQPFQQRYERVASTIDKGWELLALEQGMTRPPLLIGSGGERLVRLAAERADIVSLGGRLQVAGYFTVQLLHMDVLGPAIKRVRSRV